MKISEHWFGDYRNHHLSYLCLVGFRALIIGIEVLTQKGLLINGVLVNNQLKVTDLVYFGTLLHVHGRSVMTHFLQT